MNADRRLLIVDDEFYMAKALSYLFRRAGYEPHTAADGEEALEAIARLCPPLVILDLDLPKVSGYEVCRRIKESPGANRPYVIALTASPQDEDRCRILRLGADDFMNKPFDPADLLARVERAYP